MPPPSSGIPRSLLPAPLPQLCTFLTSSFFLLISSFCILHSAFSAPPPWWTSRGVLDPNATPDDYAPVNAGQLKNMAKALYNEIEFRVPGGPSPALYSHMEALAATPDDYVVINIGQLKNVVKPFYDFLAPFGGPAVPWPAPGLTTDDYAPANLGQLKNVFAQLDPASLLAAPVMSDDSDGDGLTNAEEIVLGTDPYTPNTVIHGQGTIVTKGIGGYRAKNGFLGFLGQNRYLGATYEDSLSFDETVSSGDVTQRIQWTLTETTRQILNVDGGTIEAGKSFHYARTVTVTTPDDEETTSTDNAWDEPGGTPTLQSRNVGGLTDIIQSDASRTSTTLNGSFSGFGSTSYSQVYSDSLLNKLVLSELVTHAFPPPGVSPSSPDWGQHHWYWPPAPYRYYWNDLPCAYGNPLQFYPYSAIRFYYPPQGSGLINSVARNKLQFALKVDNPQPGVVYVKRGVMVWRPQNGLAGNGTVVNTVNLMVKGGAGGPVVYSPAWIMEARGGYGRLDVVDSGAYLNLAGVSESEENNYGAKVIGAGTSVGISFGVGASGAAEAFRVRFHLRQGDPAHAYVRRPAPSTVQVPWDVPFEIDHSSDPNWEFGADAPGVYVIEQVTSVIIDGQDIVVDRECVTVTIAEIKIGEPDGMPIHQVELPDVHFRLQPPWCYEWQYVHVNNEVVPYHDTQILYGSVSPANLACANWSVSAGTLLNDNDMSPIYVPDNMSVPEEQQTVFISLHGQEQFCELSDQRIVTVFRDHLSRDIANFADTCAQDIDNKWYIQNFGAEPVVHNAINCHGSVLHAYNGRLPIINEFVVNSPVPTTPGNVLSFLNWPPLDVGGEVKFTYPFTEAQTTAFMGLGRGDVVAFYVSKVGRNEEVLAHSSTVVEGNLLFGVNNAPWILTPNGFWNESWLWSFAVIEDVANEMATKGPLRAFPVNLKHITVHKRPIQP